MRAISLWQPWATAIAVGAKRIETRSWGTHYRGPVAIHAAGRLVVRELADLLLDHSWRGALWPLMERTRPPSGHLRSAWWRSVMPFGAIVATADVVDCRYTDTFRADEIDVRRVRQGPPNPEAFYWTERMMGDYWPGRFGWMLDNVRPLATPLPWKGEQGWFEVPDAKIEAALAAGVTRA